MHKSRTNASSMSHWMPWVMLGIGALFYFYEYLLRVSPSVMTTELMNHYHINAAALGNLTAFYYYIYSPMQMPVGLLMDRYGPRRLLTLAAFSCAMGTFLFVDTGNIYVADFGRFLVGFGSAFAYVGVLKLATIWLPPEKFAIVSGTTMAIGTLGGMVGDLGLTTMVHHLGWETASNYAGLAGLVIVLLLYGIVRDGRHEDHAESLRADSFSDVFQGFGTIISNPQIWINGAIGCLMYVSTAAFTELWAIPYFKQALDYSPLEAASAVGMIFLGWAVGGPIVGGLSDRIKLRVLPITIGSALAAILFAIIMYMPALSKPMMHVCLFLFGLFSSAQVIVFAIGREISPIRSAGTALALTNMFVMLSGVCFQPLVGMLLDLHHSATIVAGQVVYSGASYQTAFSVIPIGLLVSVVLSFFLQETRGELLGDDAE